LKLDQWDDKQTGQKRSRLGVVLESFSFVSSGEKSEAKPATPAAQPERADGDDVPF
jgi:single-strand DNA-binding protein